MSKISRSIINEFYKKLYLIRRVEEEIGRIYPSDKIKSPVHLSIGQEAISVGVCQALQKQDIVFGTYRGHAMYLAKGGNLNSMIAELYGKITGCARGKGGSMHLIDADMGIMGTSAIVGTTIPLSVGYAYALKYKNKKSIVASFFGDGAADEGVFHESVNFAALKKLPVLFICENNGLAIHSHQRHRQAQDNIYERAKSYGIASLRVDDGDIFKIYESALDLIKRIRKGAGPAFMECITSRWREHVGPADDFYLGYRDEQEISYWKKHDQLKRLAKLVRTQDIIEFKEVVEDKIKSAFISADNAAFPGKQELKKDLFK